MTETPEDDSTHAPLFDINALLKTLWQRKLVIAAAVLVMLLAAGGYVALTQPTFTANASILVDPRDSRATNFNSVLPGLGADSAAIASQVSVIESRDLLSQVFDAQHLIDDPEYAGRGKLESILSLVRPPRPISREAVFQSFQKHVSVNREGLTYVIDVNVSSHDPVKAARIANAIVERYKASLAGEKEAANNEVTDFLQQKIGGLQKDVSKTERAVEDFKFKNNIFDAQAGGTLQARIDQLTTQIGEAQDKAGQAQDQYQQALDAGDSPKAMIKLAGILSSTTADSLRQQYNTDAAALADAEMVYGPRHPTIRRMRAQLAKVQGLMIREADRITAQLKANRDLAVQNVEKLQTKLQALRDQSNQADLARVKLRELQRNADAARAVLDDFLKRSQETTQLKGMQISQIRVISSAEPPVSATWPKPKLLLPVSGILGLIAGCALALLLGPAASVAAVRKRRPAGEAVQDEPSPTPGTAPAVRHAAVAVAPRARLTSLGSYDVPGAPGSTPRSIIKAVRMEIQSGGKTDMSLAVLRLLRQIIGRLSQHDEPFVLAVSSLGNDADAKLATALIGIGLRQLEEKVLVLEIADQPEKPGPLTSVSSRRGTAIFTDPASGLQTMVVGNDDAVGDILARHGADFNFVLVFTRPIDADATDKPLDVPADLTVFALTPAEDAAGAAVSLAERLDPEDIDRTVTIVINRVESARGSEDFRPRLVTSSMPANGRALPRRG